MSRTGCADCGSALVMPAAGAALADRHGRVKRKLRLSFTDRCNFRCRYCMPDHPQWLPKKELLTREEMLLLAGLFIDAGIEAIRVTGGEPLLRADAVERIAALNSLRSRGLRRLSMTTNASRLAPLLERLRASGLDDLNISLDALDPGRFRALRRHRIEPVLEGIDEALRRRYRVEPLPRTTDPATEFLLDGRYRLGLITTVSRPFCSSCNRLRLTSHGDLYTCLFSKSGARLGGSLRAGATPEELHSIIRAHVWAKEPGYLALRAPVERPIRMHAIGG